MMPPSNTAMNRLLTGSQHTSLTLPKFEATRVVHVAPWLSEVRTIPLLSHLETMTTREGLAAIGPLVGTVTAVQLVPSVPYRTLWTTPDVLS